MCCSTSAKTVTATAATAATVPTTTRMRSGRARPAVRGALWCASAGSGVASSGTACSGTPCSEAGLGVRAWRGLRRRPEHWARRYDRSGPAGVAHRGRQWLMRSDLRQFLLDAGASDPDIARAEAEGWVPLLALDRLAMLVVRCTTSRRLRCSATTRSRCGAWRRGSDFPTCPAVSRCSPTLTSWRRGR